MNLPGHNYLGPGNPLDNGNPVDKDDEISQAHDYDYNKAKTPEDVRTADKKAMKLFHEDLVDNGNLHSLVGLAGLGVKYMVESKTGVLYPILPEEPNDKVVNENELKLPNGDEDNVKVSDVLDLAEEAAEIAEKMLQKDS